ncbi:uncharacterized protein C2845_PM16G00880 [Panicum miliaceum]|uniref:Uncharacterized protein n=1 Tax=Panicum miliaceum TaxID=4540 RepID=A0A3L6PTS4_PANMI|nr:uncharacterized protein C2845_PM16G00880 [Panicum miliaceum]
MSAAVVVTKSSPVLVVPSESETAAAPVMAADTVALSSFDLWMLPFPMKLLVAFDRPIHEPVETIKRALSRALAHYRPAAGRLDGRGGIACTGEGVAFVGASAGCALDEAVATLPQMDLTARCPGVLCRDADPLLLVQVTEFSCGGFAVGVTWNHVLADGAGIGQFLQAVGELARGVSPPSVVPVRRWDDSVPGLPSSMVAAKKSTVDDNGPPYLVRHDIAVPLTLIGRIKAEIGCTSFEAVAAVIWRCRTRAAMSPGETPAPLSFPCNTRALVGATAGYYGNCIVGQTVPATSGAVASSSLADLARLIRRAKEKVPDLLSGSSDGEAAAPDGGAEVQQLEWYNGLAVVSWLNLGFEAADFGGGGAARVMWHEERAPLPGCMVCPPCRGDAVNVSSLCVKPEHADAFLGELARLTTAT